MRVGIHVVITQLMKPVLSFIVSKLRGRDYNLVAFSFSYIGSCESGSWNTSLSAVLPGTTLTGQSIEHLSAVPSTTEAARIFATITGCIKIDLGRWFRELVANHLLRWLSGTGGILRYGSLLLWLEVVVRLHLLRREFGLKE